MSYAEPLITIALCALALIFNRPIGNALLMIGESPLGRSETCEMREVRGLFERHSVASSGAADGMRPSAGQRQRDSLHSVPGVGLEGAAN